MFESFLQEKKYITNVSPRTLEWFKQALNWLDTESPNDRSLKNVVIKMRTAGVSPRSINSYRTPINSYLHWTTGTDLKCSPQCPHPKIPKMKSGGAKLSHFQARRHSDADQMEGKEAL